MSQPLLSPALALGRCCEPGHSTWHTCKDLADASGQDKAPLVGNQGTAAWNTKPHSCCKSINLSHWHSSHWSLQPPLHCSGGRNVPGTLKLSPTHTFINSHSLSVHISPCLAFTSLQCVSTAPSPPSSLCSTGRINTGKLL